MVVKENQENTNAVIKGEKNIKEKRENIGVKNKNNNLGIKSLNNI